MVNRIKISSYPSKITKSKTNGGFEKVQNTSRKDEGHVLSTEIYTVDQIFSGNDRNGPQYSEGVILKNALDIVYSKQQSELAIVTYLTIM